MASNDKRMDKRDATSGASPGSAFQSRDSMKAVRSTMHSSPFPVSLIRKLSFQTCAAYDSSLKVLLLPFCAGSSLKRLKQVLDHLGKGRRVQWKSLQCAFAS